MAAIPVDKMGTIDLGRHGENLATTIEIDVTSILEKWPDATITLLVKRKGDAEPYFADTSVTDAGILLWPITNVETAVVGDGRIEIQAVSGEVLAKSVTATIRVSASLSGSASSELPDVRPSWVDELLSKIGESRDVFVATAVVGPDGYYISNRTQEEIRAAVAGDKACIFIDSDGRIATYYGEQSDVASGSGKCPTFILPLEYTSGTGLKYHKIQVKDNQKYSKYSNQAATPNPQKLTFDGAFTGEYDGSKAVTINIPEDGSNLPEAGSPHQMLVTDGSGKETWEPRTHYKTVETATLLYQATLQGEGPIFALTTEMDSEPVVGQTYTLIWDGKTYSSPCEDVTSLTGVKTYGFGDLTLATEGEQPEGVTNPQHGAPYFFAYSPDAAFDGAYGIPCGFICYGCSRLRS